MKRKYLIIIALIAIISPPFLTGTIDPFICIAIHLFGLLLLFFSSMDWQIGLASIGMFLWFDVFFVFSPQMPPYQSRLSKVQEILSADQKKNLRNECDKSLLNGINGYLKYIPDEVLKRLKTPKCSPQDTMSIAIDAAFCTDSSYVYFWEADDAKIYKFSYMDSLQQTDRYVCGKEVDYAESGYGTSLYYLDIQGYLPEFYRKLEERVKLIK